jgi:DNA-binding CsgD family transcriptional regulator/tetratricopeptide (TPR) repeat protein
MPTEKGPLSSISTRLRGREDELDLIRSQVLLLGQGRGSVTVMEGPPGSGKTRLLAEAVDIARGRGTLVASGGAERSDRVVPMGALLNSLVRGAQPLLDPASFHDLRTLAELRYWLIQEIEEMLERLASDHAIVVVVDDLQWADASSVAAFEALALRLASLPIGWLGAVRITEASANLRAMLARLYAADGLQVELGPLPETAVGQLIADFAGAPPDESLLNLAASAGGGPFWLTELLFGLREDGLLEVRDGQAITRATRLPTRMRVTMRDRLTGMSRPERDVVTVAAALGRRFTFGTITGMLGAAPSELLVPVAELIRADFFVEDGEALTFRHDILQEAVLESMPSSARRALARQAVSELLRSGAPAVEVAEQLAESAEPGDSEAIDILTRAAKALGASDPSAASELTQRTLELIPREDPRRGPLVADVAVLLHAAGRPEEATSFADVALSELLPPAQESEVRYGIAGMFSLSPDVRAEAGRKALALSGLGAADRARHLARLVHNTIAAGRRAEAEALLGEAKDEIAAHGDEASIFSLGLATGGLLYTEGDFGGALERIEAAVRAGSVEGEEARARLAQQWRTEVLATVDRFDEAIPLAISALESAQRDSQAWAVHLWEQWRGRQHYQLGEFSDAIAALEGMLRPEETQASLGANDAAAISALAGSAVRVGDRVIGRRCAEFAALVRASGTPELKRHAAWILAQQAAAAGNPRVGVQIMTGLERELPPEEPVLPLFPLDVLDQPQLVRIALAAGDRALAERTSALARDRAEKNPSLSTVNGAALHADGLLHLDQEALRGAIEHFERSPRWPALASALEDLGVLSTRQEAIALLWRALELARKMGATWDATRLRRRLRALGVRRRLTSQERPDRGWGALTEREVAVVKAITNGMTNREAAAHLFLSPHTVSMHLRHAFEKLEINSRAELARIGAEHPRTM